jgi:D-aminoacyl-tRNA deacylase
LKLIVVSEADPTSILAGRLLIEGYGFKPIRDRLYAKGDILLRVIAEKHVYVNGLGEDLKPELQVVASSHRSEAGIRALLTHPVGNWGDEALVGGLPRTLSPTSAIALYGALRALHDAASELGLEGWNIGMEATHHGPATSVPIIFIEAGGPLEEPDQKAVEAVARACIAACETCSGPLPAIGFGGGHYAPSFTRLALAGEYSFGHMCPKYAMPVDRMMIEQAFEKTIEKPRLTVIDWKGLRGQDRDLLLSILKDLGVEWVRV